MSQTHPSDQGIQLTLSIWHPNCWTLQVTEQVNGGLLAHAVYNSSGEQVKGLFTAYGDSSETVSQLIEAVETSPLTDSVLELRECYGTSATTSSAPGNAKRELFVEYNSKNTISDVLVSRGFIHSEPVRIHKGREYWPVFFPGSREDIDSLLDEIRSAQNADIKVTSITTAGSSINEDNRKIDRLSKNQREVFELAREHNYYAWPREITTRELAAKLDISKTTMLEHLRKAESKLLDPDE